MRKTISRELLVATANRAIQHAPTEAERVAIATTLESVLHMSNAYAGFTYPASERDEERHGALRDGYDDSNRRYF